MDATKLERIKRIIRALLEKSESLERGQSNANGATLNAAITEAATALAQAKKLMALYNLSASDFQNGDDNIITQIEYASDCGLVGVWFSILCQAIGENLSVRFIFANKYQPACAIRGAQAEIETAKELLDGLTAKAKLYFDSLSDGSIQMLSYFNGFALGVLDCVREENKREEAEINNEANEANAANVESENPQNEASEREQSKLDMGLIIASKSQRTAMLARIDATIGDTAHKVENFALDDNKSTVQGYHDGLHHKAMRVA